MPDRLAGDRTLLLDVEINGRAIGLIGEFREHGHRLFATCRELASLGFHLRACLAPPNAAAPDPARNPDPALREVALSDQPGVAVRVDERRQVLHVTADAGALSPVELGRAGGQPRAPVQSGLGAVLNYDVATTAEFGAHGASGVLAEALLEGRVFSPWGVAEQSAVATAGAAAQTPPLVRLDTSYTLSQPDSLRRIAFGDVITTGPAWSEPIRLGGIQIGTDFATRPDLVTFPLPSLSGQVAVPSSVDVLLNGTEILSRDVPPGPFELQQLPVVTGAGTVTVVTRDANGQQNSQTLPIYASTLLLAPGLQSYGAELGAVRLNYAERDDGYHGAAGTLSYRRGLLPWLTLEGHAEASLSAKLPDGTTSQSGAMAGGGASVALGQLGAVSLDAAASRFGNTAGKLVSASFERNARFFSLTGAAQFADKSFRDVASAFGDPPITLQIRAGLGVSLGQAGSLGLAFVALRRGSARQDTASSEASLQQTGLQQTPSAFGLGGVAALQATHASLVSASYTRSFFGGAMSFFATGFTELSQPRGTGATIGFTLPLGTRRTLDASLDAGEGRTDASLGINQTTSAIGDLGWHLRDDAGQQPRQLAEGQYKAPWALLDAGVDRIGGQTSLRGSVEGALAYADGGLFATNTIHDSFAVVDTDRTPNITVLQENRPVGRTDASGLLLVTDLQAFAENRLGIDPMDVPLDEQIERSTLVVLPQDRSGVIVHFPVHSFQGALVRLTDEAGKPLPPGSRVTVEGATARPQEIGFGGEAFLTGLQAHNRVIAIQPDGQACHAKFDLHPKRHWLPKIGPIPCLATAA